MNLQVIKNRIRKTLTYSVTGLVFLVICCFLILQIPSVQESLIKRYLGKFSKVTGFRTTVEHFQLLWFDRLELQGVNVYDPAENRMIAAKKILINFKLSHLFEQRDINIDGIELEKGQVFLTKIQESDTSRDLNINIFIKEINQHYGGSNKGGRSPRINIGEAIISQSQFSYIDQFRDSIQHGFNYNQFTFDIDEGQLQNFLILGDTTQFNVRTLLAVDQKTKFKIRQLSTFFRLSQQSMEFIGLDLKAGESTISDTVIFTFNGQRELSDFVHKVNIHARLDKTVIQPADLALFAPEAAKLTEPLNVSGVFNGRVDDFKLTQMEIGTGNTILRGALDMEGLPDIVETFINLDLKNSKLDFNDLSFLFKDQTLARLTPLGRVSMNGQIQGYPTDFVANGQFEGKLGLINSDINFKVNENNFDRSEYSGKLALTDFKLGQYLRDTVNFQEVNLNGNVKGTGLTVKTADFKLNGEVRSIGIRNYNYKNITTNARFATQLFNGFFKINDPNLQFTAEGSADLRENHNIVKIHAQLDTAFLQKLKLTDKNIFVHSDIDVNIKGLHIDSITGTADLKDFKLFYNNKWLTLQDIHINAQRRQNERSVQLKTTLLDGEARGNFLLSDISRDIQKLVHEVVLNMRNDKEAIAEYYQTKSYRPKSYQTDFNLTIKDIDPIVKLLNVDLLISDNTNIGGKFTSGYTSILQAYTRADSISYNQSLLLDTEIEITASKIADSTSVLAMAFINSSRQQLTPNLRTRDLIAEAIWSENHIDFELDADQEGKPNYLRLKGAVDFLKDSTQFKVMPSTLKLLEKSWEFDGQNLITIYKREIKVNELKMRNGNEFIVANGVVSPDPTKKLSLQVVNADLSVLSPIIGREVEGTLNAWFDIHNYYANPYIQNELHIDSLTIDKFLVGNVAGKNQWDTLGNKLLINFFVDRHKDRIVNVQGFFDPSQKNSPLDVTAKLEKANLKILEPFLEDIFSNISGTITGDYRISGKLEEPLVQGEGVVADGQLTMNYLKTVYQFQGKIGLSPHSIYFKDIELQDIYKNKGRVNGTITHHNFYSMRINLDASFENFHVLNTNPKDNSLFYGQGFASGDVNLFGPVSNLKITANARTEKNTRISIPISGGSEVEKKDFIRFVSFSDSTFQKSLHDEISNKIHLTGIEMNFNLDVTPDALCEIIFDIKAGDIIRGRGNGDLQFQLDTKGEFNMFGAFEFTQGLYNFTLYNIVNKDFEIQKGSRITWYGDPYGGLLDISATYNQLASFAPILKGIISDDVIENSPQLRRKYPTQVLLKLDGPMLGFQINLDIVAKDLPPQIYSDDGQTVRLDFAFQTFKNKIDEQELKRQVFSLIVLRRFSPLESFNTSGSIVSSMSELLSNQLSNWMSQVDENLEIDVDLSTLDDDAFNTFQLRLSYTLFGGRLRLTRDGTFYGNQNNNPNFNNTQANISAIAGDWTVDYLLTADGKLKVKMYNRTNVNPLLNSLGAQNSSVTTGVSLTHTQNFNELKDLLKAARKKKETPEPPPDANKEATKKDDDGSE